jgi:hypothetical protein
MAHLLVIGMIIQYKNMSKNKCKICDQDIQSNVLYQEDYDQMNIATIWPGNDINLDGHKKCLDNINKLVVIPNRYKVDELRTKLMKNQQKKWLQLKYMSKNDYGKIAIIGLVLAFIKTGIPVPLNPLLNFLVNVIITFGLFAGIMWIIEKSKRNKK